MKLIPGRQPKNPAVQFDVLVRPHVPTLYQVAYKLAGSRVDAEDIVQDVLIKLYTHLPEMLCVDELKPWLMRVLYNQFVDYCRKQQRNPAGSQLAAMESSEAEASGQWVTSNPGPEQAVEAARQSREVLAALDGLDQDKRALVVLHLMEGYTLDELTAVFNAPLGTLKSRLHRAKAELKRRLSVEPFAEIERGRDKVN